jgi:hypothetical protein
MIVIFWALTPCRFHPLQSWWWRQYVSPKRLYLFTSPHGVITQKNIILTAVRTWDVACLLDWLIMMGWDYVSNATTKGPIVHPPGDKWAWTAMLMMLVGDNSWIAHQSSVEVLQADTSGANRRNRRRSENFSYQYLRYLKGCLTCRKVLRHGTSGFTSHSKEGVLRIFIALKNESSWPGLNPRPFGPVASTLTTTRPRRHLTYYRLHTCS